MDIVKSHRYETGGGILPADPDTENGPCFEHGPFFTHFRGNVQNEK